MINKRKLMDSGEALELTRNIMMEAEARSVRGGKALWRRCRFRDATSGALMKKADPSLKGGSRDCR
jgi:hypothetical protein